MSHPSRGCALAAAVCAVSFLSSRPLRADNQTPILSSIKINTILPFSTTISPGVTFNDTLPTLQSFAKAQLNGQWLLIGGITNGQHIGPGIGFSPAHHNTTAYVVDPITQEVWSRSFATDPLSDLSPEQVSSLSTTNCEFTQIGSKLYLAGGYAPITGLPDYHTYDTLTSIDIASTINWVKGASSASASTLIRQISDPMFRVTGGEMHTTSNGLTHLIFGQDYPANYAFNVNGIYTNQVRTFRIVDDASGLTVSDIILHATNADFRRRDLNVVPIIQKVNNQLVDKIQALAGVFTPTFGAWTVPVTIDGNGNATEPIPLLPTTFKQGMNSYRSANIGLYSSNSNTMYTLLLGGISYQFRNPISGLIQSDLNLPYINDCTVLITDANGAMSQHLLSTTFPSMTDADGDTLYFGTETEFFLKPGIPAFENGVINLDLLSGPTLIGYLYGGIISDAPNNGNSVASNLLFPVIINVPEPTSLALLAAGLSLLTLRRRARNSIG